MCPLGDGPPPMTGKYIPPFRQQHKYEYAFEQALREQEFREQELQQQNATASFGEGALPESGEYLPPFYQRLEHESEVEQDLSGQNTMSSLEDGAPPVPGWYAPLFGQQAEHGSAIEQNPPGQNNTMPSGDGASARLDIVRIRAFIEVKIQESARLCKQLQVAGQEIAQLYEQLQIAEQRTEHFVKRKGSCQTLMESRPPTPSTEHTSNEVVPVSCGRCGLSVQTHDSYYHCLGCNDDYNLCLECARQGVYCDDDTHPWEELLLEDGKKSRVGEELTPAIARKRFSTDYPSMFRPPHPKNTPGDLFERKHRYIRYGEPRNRREIFIDTASASLYPVNQLKNEQQQVCGWSFVHRPLDHREDAYVAGCLEENGPGGESIHPTQARAAIRAIIAALQFTNWADDCHRQWRSIVIATTYTKISLFCELAMYWEQSGWHRSKKKPIYDGDLWKLLLQEIRKLQGEGVRISFWEIDRTTNKKAYLLAQGACQATQDPNTVCQRLDGRN